MSNETIVKGDDLLVKNVKLTNKNGGEFFAGDVVKAGLDFPLSVCRIWLEQNELAVIEAADSKE